MTEQELSEVQGIVSVLSYAADMLGIVARGGLETGEISQLTIDNVSEHVRGARDKALGLMEVLALNDALERQALERANARIAALEAQLEALLNGG
jgi:hypothetical protein